MSLPTFLIDVRTDRRPDLERDVNSGGLYLAGVQHPLNQHCEITFRFHDLEHVVDARVVFADPSGIGLELFVLPRERAALLEKIRNTVADAGPGPTRDEVGDGDAGDEARAQADDDDAAAAAAEFDEGPALAQGPRPTPSAARRGEGRPLPVHERVRNLSVGEQLKLAHHGEQQERILLERLYGKTVWEALLRNPRITAPEVARIARMGALPRPLMEGIVSNATWLQVPEVRRALLGNPRLAPEQIARVLRMLPRHELKLVPSQLAYPAAVRDVARRMLRD